MTSEPKDRVVTHLGVAHPWMRAVGHMNVRHYMFNDAGFHLPGKLTEVEKDKSLGWPDVRHADIRRHAEALILD